MNVYKNKTSGIDENQCNISQQQADYEKHGVCPS